MVDSTSKLSEGKNGCSINNLENQHNVCIKTDPDIGAYNQMISISGRQDDVNVAELPKPSATLIRHIVNICHPMHSVRKADDIALLDTDTNKEYKRGTIPHEKARIAWLMSRHSCPSCEVNDDISLEEV
ncbi:hypothetical protein KIN20_010274 [Parelaphostrongylus tenuis]|uniref:Uncharacterized protein n=1 Tax=Parelaphostrongylus tenuis TaxID=148309 RepID=A0AAD5MCB6_PARTN|nr:hypothetical protein KIN20_010274 [Parelaphostrongylus tenuis]